MQKVETGSKSLKVIGGVIVLILWGRNTKQRTYNNRMGLDILNMICKKIRSDIGEALFHYSLNIKNRGICAVVDPLKVPNWVVQRYYENNIVFLTSLQRALNVPPYMTSAGFIIVFNIQKIRNK